MQRKFDDTNVYFEEDDLQKMHNNLKEESHTQVCFE